MKHKYVHLKGEHVRKVLIHCFDAKEEDINELEDSHDNLNHDPNMDERKIATYRLGFVIYVPNLIFPSTKSILEAILLTFL